MINNKKTTDGVTLIALVITVIILLILAGITINLTIKENGIMKQAEIAREENKRAQIRENLDLRLVDKQTQYYWATNEKIIEETRKNVIEKPDVLKKIANEIEVKEIVKEKNDIYFYVIADRGVYKVSLEGTKYIGEQTKEDAQLRQGNIIFSYEPEEGTNKNILIEISIDRYIIGNTLQYKTQKSGAGGEVADWTDYTGEITLTRNQDVYARIVDSTGKYVKDEDGNVIVATGTVVNIDKLAPKTFTPEAKSTTSSITVIAETTDEEATSDNSSTGIAGYRFSIDNGSTWTEYQENGSYTYNNLIQDKEYTITVDVKDKVGNKTTGSVTITTGEVAGLQASDVTYVYSPNGWTNENVLVGIKRNIDMTGYRLQYKTEESGQASESTEWTYYTGSISITRNQDIYARIVDNSGQYAKDENGNAIVATGTVTNIDTVAPTIGTALSSSDITTSGFTLNVGVVDGNGSGIGKIVWKYKLSSESTYTTIEQEYVELNGTSKGPTGTNASQQITGLTSGATYDAIVDVYDVAGNKTTPLAAINITTKQLVTEITLDKTSTTIIKGNTDTLTATVLPSNAENKNVIWTSSDESIATVSDGVVTAVSTGTATITATAEDGSGVSASCEVTVEVEKLYLYNYGDTCTDVTGGYAKYTDGIAPTMTLKTDYIYTYAYTNDENLGSEAWWRTKNKIDVSDYSTLNFNIKISGLNNAYWKGALKTSSSSWVEGKAVKQKAVESNGTKTVTLDVSDLTGSYYLYHGVHADGTYKDGTAGSVKVYIYEIWLE